MNTEIRRIKPAEFDPAMDILEKELGDGMGRTRKELKKTFNKTPEFFIGAFIDDKIEGIICGFPREDYLLMSEIAVYSQFQKHHFGKKLMEEFEKKAFEKYNKIKLISKDDVKGFYFGLGFTPSIFIQFEDKIYTPKDFENEKIISMKRYGVELTSENCSEKELATFREKYPLANMQYLFTKEKNTNK